MDIIRSGIEGIAFRQRIAGQRAKAHPFIRLCRKEPFRLRKTERIQVQDQACTDDRTAGKASARPQMTAKDHIDTKNHDRRDEQLRDRLKNDIVLRLIDPVVGLPLLNAVPALLFVDAQQNEYRTGRNKEHVRFA